MIKVANEAILSRTRQGADDDRCRGGSIVICQELPHKAIFAAHNRIFHRIMKTEDDPAHSLLLIDNYFWIA